MPRMTLMLYERRKRTLELYYAGVSPSKIVEHIVEKFHATRKAAELDLGRRKAWEPLIWAAIRTTGDYEKLMNYLTLGAEQAYSLCKSATPDFAKVSALNTLVNIVVRTMELQQSVGLLHKEPDRLAVEKSETYAIISKVLVEIIKKDNPKLIPKIYEALEKC